MTENISLCLKTTQINASSTFADYYNKTVSTSSGKIENNRTTYTWYNVNLRNLLGPIYNKYNKFNISLNNIGTGIQSGTAVLYSYERQLQVKMSGLQWLSSYNQATQNNDSNKVIKLIQLSSTASGSDSLQFNEEFFTFLKGSDIVDIVINLHTIDYDTNASPTASQYLLPHMIFNFNIQGVPEELNDKLEIKQKSNVHINDVKLLR